MINLLFKEAAGRVIEAIAITAGTMIAVRYLSHVLPDYKKMAEDMDEPAEPKETEECE